MLSEKNKNGNPELSKQETIVAECISKGLKNEEIAKLMCISVNTVKTYQARIFQKCAVRNRVELTIWYYNNIKQLNF